MPKKIKHKPSRRKASSPKKQPVGFFYFRRLVIVSVIAAFFLTALFAITQTREWYFLTTGKEQFLPYDPSQTVGYYNGKSFQVPPVQIAYNTAQENQSDVLGDTTNKRIEVDLTNQHVYAYEGDQRIYDFVVSTGLWGRTPTGEFTVQRRVPVQTMAGGSKALRTYYYLPGVKNVQYFGNASVPWWKGFSFHATYWHNNFGHPMSHGCINMKTEDALTLWNWTGDVGTRVVIYGTTQAS
jgi:lipoprotein-anchoring transpeptidase ErfK/SrfK